MASNPDLIGIFGTNTNLATQHYVKYGYNEGRPLQNFDAAQYLNNYPDFWNWNEAVAARVTHKKETKPPYDDFEEDFKASCDSDNKDFDEEWEK